MLFPTLFRHETMRQTYNRKGSASTCKATGRHFVKPKSQGTMLNVGSRTAVAPVCEINGIISISAPGKKIKLHASFETLSSPSQVRKQTSERTFLFLNFLPCGIPLPNGCVSYFCLTSLSKRVRRMRPVPTLIHLYNSTLPETGACEVGWRVQ